MQHTPRLAAHLRVPLVGEPAPGIVLHAPPLAARDGEPSDLALRAELHPALPPPDWRHLAADVPAVIAAVEGLAGAFDLHPQPDGRWTVEYADPAVRGELRVLPDGAHARVGVAMSIGDGIVSSRALILMSGVSISVAGVTALLTTPFQSIVLSAMNFLGPLFAAASTFVVSLIVYKLLSAWRQRQVRRWADIYQRRLWLALEGRIGRGRIYR